jgi:hypothetical protein
MPNMDSRNVAIVVSMLKWNITGKHANCNAKSVESAVLCVAPSIMATLCLTGAMSGFMFVQSVNNLGSGEITVTTNPVYQT